MPSHAIKPTTIKSYIDGQHESICDSCHHMYRCRSYERTKKVFFCSSNPQKSEKQKKKFRIISQSEEEKLCEEGQQETEK
jgi:hypothetical protein